jgi:hypothetical protein
MVRSRSISKSGFTCTFLFLDPIVRTNKSSGIGSGFAGSGSRFARVVSGCLAAVYLGVGSNCDLP